MQYSRSVEFITHRDEVKKSLGSLDAAIKVLVEELRGRGEHWWVDGGSNAKEAICDAIERIDYRQEESVGETSNTNGIVCLPTESFHYVESVNRAKDDLKAVFAAISNKTYYDKAKKDRITLAKALLRDLGRSSLKRPHAYRHLFVEQTVPYSLGYTSTYTRTVERKEKAEILSLVVRAHHAQTSDFDRRVIDEMPDNTLFALVKGPFNNTRVNIFRGRDYHDPEGVLKQRQQKPGHMPLILPPFEQSNAPKIHPRKVRDESDKINRDLDRVLKREPLITLGDKMKIYLYE